MTQETMQLASEATIVAFPSDQPRAVVDTNVALDWLYFKDPSAQWLFGAVAFELVTSASCVTELERVLQYPALKASTGDQRQCLDQYRALTRVVTVDTEVLHPRCRDVDDQKFISLCAAAKASVLITRDSDLLKLSAVMKKLLDVRVMTAVHARTYNDGLLANAGRP